MVKFSPSLLASDYSNLREELTKVKDATYLHLDVMDGAFVPNISYGAGLIKAIRPYSDLEFDTHLMIENPEKYIKDYAEAGSDLITIHVESTRHLHRVLQQIKQTDCLAGVALNPATPLESIEYVLQDLDLILIMSVNPGFGGQKFIPQIYNKISRLKQIIDNRNLSIMISVDGGINKDNINDVIEAGTDIIVAGSAIFKQPQPAQTLREFKEITSG